VYRTSGGGREELARGHDVPIPVEGCHAPGRAGREHTVEDVVDDLGDAVDDVIGGLGL
jgi:hypothetical protein